VGVVNSGEAYTPPERKTSWFCARCGEEIRVEGDAESTLSFLPKCDCSLRDPSVGATHAEYVLASTSPEEPCSPSPGSNEPNTPLAEGERERNRWIRLFNRLDAAISRHRKAKAWTDDTDDALHAAHDKVLKAAASPVERSGE
jgi:hypothetical protein